MAPAPKRIALILPKGHDHALRLVAGVLHAVKDRPSYRFVEIPYDEHAAPPGIASLAVEGALVWTHPGVPWVIGLRDRGVKVVSLNAEWQPFGIPCVGTDVAAMVRLGIEHLARLGRGHAAFVGHMIAPGSSKQRQRDLFLEEAGSRGWTAAAVEVPGIPSEERKRLAEPAAERKLGEFLRGLPTPAVVACDDDYVAALVCSVAEHVGLRVPDDLAVLGQFDMAVARFNVPTISSMPGPGQLVGAAGMRLLAGLLAGKEPPAEPVLVAPPDVVCRESTGGTTLRDDDIRRAHDLIERFACEGLTVEQLLTRITLSRNTLAKQFEAVYGRSPGAMIRHVRAERAKHLLSTTDLSIGRVADMCGFGEPSNFTQFFSREVGCTPGDFRAKSR